jgi:hypothetical protein
MASKVVCKVIDEQQAKYDKIGIKPWHHIVIDNGYAFVYVWDTRVIEMVIPESCLEQDDLTYAVIDNGMDLRCSFDAKPSVKELCMAHKESMPIMFLSKHLTEDEQALLDITHY